MSEEVVVVVQRDEGSLDWVVGGDKEKWKEPSYSRQKNQNVPNCLSQFGHDVILVLFDS